MVVGITEAIGLSLIFTLGGVALFVMLSCLTLTIAMFIEEKIEQKNKVEKNS